MREATDEVSILEGQSFEGIEAVVFLPLALGSFVGSRIQLGFENMRELVTYLDRYMVDLKEVEATYLLLPLSATDEMYSIGKDLILDV